MPKTREMTRDELNNLLNQNIDKVGLAGRRGVKDNTLSFERLKEIAKYAGIPLERDRTPSPERASSPIPNWDNAQRMKIIKDIRQANATNPVEGFPNVNANAGHLSNEDLYKFARKAGVVNSTRTTPERKMTAEEQSVYNLNEWKKKQAEADRIKTRKDEEYGAKNERPSQGVHIKHNNMLDQLLEEVRNKNKRKEQNKPEPAPQGIKKSILKSLGSKPKGSLLETINSIQSNPEEIYRKRTRAVTFAENPVKMSSQDRVKFDRDRQRIDTGMWNKPTKPYEEIPIEELPNKDPEVLSSYIDKDMKLPAAVDSTKIEHGPVWSQQMGKGIAEKTLKLMSKPHQPYMQPTVANLSSGEQKARDMALYESPFANEKFQNEENEIEDRILDIGESPGATDAANPYMKAFSNNPANMHEELVGPMERAQLASIREESDKNLYDKLLPELKRKYMVPGMKRAGHLNKEVRDLVRDYSKGREHAINQAMTQNRLGTLGVAQKHMGLQGNAAQMAAENSKSDTEKAMKTTNMLNLAKKERYDTRKDYIKDEERRGMIDRQLHQDKMNADQIRFIEAREHPMKQLSFGATINRGLDVKPFVQESTIGQLRKNPNAVNPNLFQNVGAGMASLAADRMPRKKGGLIKTRCKKADGGQIMQEAVNNAVIDKDDPLTALRRLMNRQRMMDVSESKIGKRRYRDGGQVNPIQQGAAQARQFLGEKDLRAHIESQKTPYQKPAGTSMMDAFMRGVGSLGGTTGLGAMARGYNPGAEARDAEIANGRAQKDKAFRDTYALDQNAKAEEANLKREAREERKFLSDEKFRNASLAQTAKYQRGRLAQGANKPLKLSRADNEVLSSSTKTLTAAPDLLDDLSRMKELSKKLKTGTYRNKIAGTDAYWLAKAGVGNQADIEEYNKLSNSLATKAGAVFGNRAGAAVVKLFREEKPNIEMDPKAIENIINKMESQVNRAIERGYYVQESLDDGIAPSKASVEFDRILKTERDAKEKLKNVKQNAIEPNQNKVTPSIDQEQMNLPESEEINDPRVSSLLSKKARLAELEAMGR